MPPSDDTRSTVYTFGEIEIDPATSSIRRGGLRQYLRPKTFQVLMHLVANRDRVVSKEELLEAVWPGTAVTDDTLVQSIGDIRKAVKDDPRESWFIRTIPRVGYSLIAPLERAADRPGPTGIAPGRGASLDNAARDPRTELARPPWRFLLAGGIAALMLLVAVLIFARRSSSTVPSTRLPVRAIQKTVHPEPDHLTDNSEAYEEYTRGVRAADNLEIGPAIEALRCAVALDPGFAMAYARIGYTYAVRSSRHDQAKAYLAQALAHGDRLNERERTYVQAWQEIANHDFAEAIDHYRLLVSRYPTDVEAFEGLGRLLVGEERIEEAVEVFRRGLVIDPDSTHLNNAMGSAASYLGRHDEAIRFHQRYVSFAPNAPNAHDSLGLSYQWSGHYDHAIAEYGRALQLNPRFEIALVHRAATFWQTGRIREAIRDFQQYLAIAPSAIERGRAHGELSYLYRSLGDVQREVPAARKAKEEDSDGLTFEILSAIDQGDVAKARRLVEAMPSPSGGNRGARYPARLQYVVRTEVARASGDAKRAIEYAREAVRRLPTIYLIDDHEDVLADTLAAFNRHPEAIEEYRRVLGINEHRGRTRFKLARSLDAAGRGGDARLEYQRFLTEWQQADSDVPEVLAARSRLGRS